MPKKLRNLFISEVSLVAKGANPHARIVLCKRDAPEIQVPKDSAPHDFNATGRGPAHDALWESFDNHRRQMNPAQGRQAFETAWAELDDAGKQAIRNEEASTEAASRLQQTPPKQNESERWKKWTY